MSTLRRKKYIFFLPVFIYLFAFSIFPIGHTLYMSFNKYQLGGGFRFVGIDNYVDLFTSVRFLNALANSFKLVFGAVTLEFIFGLMSALILNRKFFGKPMVYWIVLLPMIITPVVVGMTFNILFDPSLGLLNYIIGLFGLKGPHWLTNDKIALFTIMLIDTWEWTPFMTLILLSGLRYIPDTLKDAARVDGASAIQVFRYITLPLLKGIMIIALIFRSLDHFAKTFAIIFTTTRGGPGYTTENVPILGFRTAFLYAEFGKASAQGIILVFFTILIITVILFVGRRK